MADSTIPIQPAAPAAPAAAPTLVKTFQQSDEFGNVVQAQAVTLVDSNGRELLLATRDDMKALITAVRELHAALLEINGGGAMYPSSSSTLSDL